MNIKSFVLNNALICTNQHLRIFKERQVGFDSILADNKDVENGLLRNGNQTRDMRL